MEEKRKAKYMERDELTLTLDSRSPQISTYQYIHMSESILSSSILEIFLNIR